MLKCGPIPFHAESCVLIQVVGPILAEEAKPLPADLDKFLSPGIDGHGAIYVSMGTLARLNAAELRSMAEALSALPNPVLWKLDKAHLPGMPSNCCSHPYLLPAAFCAAVF